jgi:hypothetical protein
MILFFFIYTNSPVISMAAGDFCPSELLNLGQKIAIFRGF